jgi:hypothetical protein
VKVGGKNVTPKKLMTNQLLEIQGNFFSQDADRLKDEKPSSPNHSGEDSGQRSSSQLISSVISESKSETSESDSKKGQDKVDKKHAKKEEDPEDLIPIALKETATQILLVVPSALTPGDPAEVARNKAYRKYMQEKIGSDNYVKRPVQTFNYQPKIAFPQVESTPVHTVEAQADLF